VSEEAGAGSHNSNQTICLHHLQRDHLVFSPTVAELLLLLSFREARSLLLLDNILTSQIPPNNFQGYPVASLKMIPIFHLHFHTS